MNTKKQNTIKYEIENKALIRENDLLSYTNKSLIRQKTLYESELNILCARIEKAVYYAREHNLKKLENILTSYMGGK